MSKTGKNLLRIGLGVVFLFTAVLACRPTPVAEGVTVAINDPPDGSTVAVGQEVVIDSTVTSAAGVARVDLSVDGQVVRYDTPPSGNPTTFRVSQSWMPTSEGQVAISVTGYDVEAAMDQVTVTLQAVVVSVVINSPPDGDIVLVGQEVRIDSTTSASSGVTQVELYVDDVVVRRDVPPSGEPTTFRVSQPWMPVKEGQAVISVVAYVNEASSKATITLQVLASGGVVPTAPPMAEPETPPPVTTEAGCTLDSQYVADVTTPDGMVMSPGAGFVKTWEVKNSGTCDWDAGFQLIFVGGAQMGGPPSVLLPAVPAGGQTDVSVNLTAPTAYGTHKGTWRIRSDEGTVFGANLMVLIVVASPATEAPVTETPLPTDMPTIVGPLPNLETYAFFTDPSTIVAGADFDVTVTVANFTDVPVANFTIHVLLMDPGESCLEGGSGTLLLDRQASIAAQQFATVGTTARIDTAGQHTLCLRIDPSDAVEELYEDDNDMQLTFTVSASPEAD